MKNLSIILILLATLGCEKHKVSALNSNSNVDAPVNNPTSNPNSASTNVDLCNCSVDSILQPVVNDTIFNHARHHGGRDEIGKVHRIDAMSNQQVNHSWFKQCENSLYINYNRCRINGDNDSEPHFYVDKLDGDTIATYVFNYKKLNYSYDEYHLETDLLSLGNIIYKLDLTQLNNFSSSKTNSYYIKLLFSNANFCQPKDIDSVIVKINK